MAKTIWMTGLSGSGKTTLANMLKRELVKEGHKVQILDGDVVRNIFPTGFSKKERDDHIKRVGYMSKLLNDNGITTICAFISPYEEARNFVKDLVDEFVLVYVECDLDMLIQRDTKGLYKKAIAGEIKEFTGINDPYEIPENGDITINTTDRSPLDSLVQLLCYLEDELLK